MKVSRILGVAASLMLVGQADASDQSSPGDVIDDTQEAACALLKDTVVRQRHLPNDTPVKWHWSCEFSTIDNEYLRIIALRAGKCDAANCLMGWFAVMRRSTVVLEYDVGEDRVVALAEYPATGH